MGTESIQVSGVINASPERIFGAWLDSTEHTAFTGGKAVVESGAGGRFTAWDGYIQGTTIELEPGRRIVQSWRSSEFPAGSPDSRLEVVLEPIAGGTRLTFVHSNIPEGLGARFEQGWRDHYLSPMEKYFGGVQISPPAADEEEFESAAVSSPKPAKKASPRKPGKKKASRKTAKSAKKPKKKAKKKAKPKKKAKRKAKRKAPKRRSAKKRSRR